MARQHAAAVAALLVCCAALLLSSAAAAAAAADAAPKTATAPTTAPAPRVLGQGADGASHPMLRPRGSKFVGLMRQLIQAARGGNLDLAQQLQQQLFAITRPGGAGHRRRQLLQPAEDACPALASSDLFDVGPPSGSQEATSAASVPSIGFYNLEPCAEFGCRTQYTLVRQPDGTITCRGPRNSPTGPPARAVPVEDFAYFQVYDYDALFNTDGNNVLRGLYAGSTLSNQNQVNTRRGEFGAKSNLASSTQVRVQPSLTLGVRGDTDVSGEVNTGVKLSKKPGDVGVLEFASSLPKLTASGAYTAVLPGTVVAEREGDAEDSNVVLRSNNPALFGFFGKKR